MMSNSETQSLYVLLRYLLNAVHNGNPVPAEDAAREATVYLAERAQRASGGGLGAELVEQLWRERHPQPASSGAS